MTLQKMLNTVLLISFLGLLNGCATGIKISGKLDHPTMEKAFNEIVCRHEILRTKFVVQAGQPQQEIVSKVKISIPIEDISKDSNGQKDLEFQRRIKAEGKKPFNLNECPLFRTKLFYLGQSLGREE